MLAELARMIQGGAQGVADYYNSPQGQAMGDYMFALNQHPQSLVAMAQAQAQQSQTRLQQQEYDTQEQLRNLRGDLDSMPLEKAIDTLMRIDPKYALEYARVRQESDDMKRKQTQEESRQKMLSGIFGGESQAQEAPADPSKIAAYGAMTGDPSMIQYAGFLQGQDKVDQAQKNRNEDKKTNADSRIFDQETKLRDKFINESGEFVKVRDAYSRIGGAAKDSSAAGDLALIFNYMKILDPGSTVREGEFANAQNAGGVGDRIMATYNNILNGERLTEKQRKDFLSQSKNLYGSMEKNQGKLEKRYQGLSQQYGLDPKRVVQDMRADVPDITANSVPESAAADGLTQEDWNSMTDEERALWH